MGEESSSLESLPAYRPLEIYFPMIFMKGFENVLAAYFFLPLNNFYNTSFDCEVRMLWDRGGGILYYSMYGWLLI